jgi:putative redox protein
MKATVKWQGNLKFTGIPESGNSVPMDADSQVGGVGEGIRPMEMIALGLAGCTAMDVISILQKKHQEVIRFEVAIDAPRSEDHPKVFISAVITYSITGRNIDEAAVLRAMELSATKYCPAQAMLGQVFPIAMHYEIYEDEGEGTQKLTHEGIWQEQLQV